MAIFMAKGGVFTTHLIKAPRKVPKGRCIQAVILPPLNFLPLS